MKPNNSRIPRLFLDVELRSDLIPLAKQQAHYLRRVLRLKAGDSVVLFNGAGDERQATLTNLDGDGLALQIIRTLAPLPEPSLEVSLIQALVKADAMDMIVQKATELGVRTLIPVSTEFSVVKLDAERAARRVAHWQKIAQSACEQSGRHRPPTICSPQQLGTGLTEIAPGHVKLALHPGSAQPLHAVSAPTTTPTGVAILIGPEGGLSNGDLQLADDAGFERVTLGPRILRAETAAVAACVLVQSRWGDLRG